MAAPMMSSDGLQKWTRFAVLEEKARKCGCKLKLDLVSPELLESAKKKVSLINVPDQCKDLWLQLKATLPQEPLSLDPSDPTQIDSLLHKERISDLCSKAYKLQLECLEEGLTLDQIPTVIKTRALDELHDWERRATLGAGMEIYQEWKEIVTVLVHQNEEHGDKDRDTPQQKQNEGSSLDVTVEHFLSRFVSTAADSVTAIVNSIDEQMHECNDTSAMELQKLPHSSKLLKEIEALRVENEALKVQLTKELDELKKENTTLKQKLRNTELHYSQSSTKTTNVSAELQTNESSVRIRNQPSQQSNTENELSESTIKHFNAIPKTLATFYEQMENGDDCLLKFECLPEVFKKNKRTKAVYSKRKNIYTYIQNFDGGWEAFLRAHGKSSTLQVYEQVIKRSRAPN